MACGSFHEPASGLPQENDSGYAAAGELVENPDAREHVDLAGRWTRRRRVLREAK
jgi:hypothetical protein